MLPGPARTVVPITLITAALLPWPALLLSGAPLIFSDSVDYLSLAAGLGSPMRAPGYAWFIAVPTMLTGSLWPTILLQAVLIATLAHATLRLVQPERGAFWHLGVGIGMAALTTAPWMASYVMPDTLTAPGLLAVFLAIALPPGRRLMVALTLPVIALAAASHITHAVTALAVVAVLALARLLVGRAMPLRWNRLALAAAAILFGIGAVMGVNAALTGRVEYGRSDRIFLGARLAADGLLQRYLASTCPDPRLPLLCAARTRIPMNGDLFLWAGDSPLRDDGDFFAIEPELTIATPAVLRAYWPQWAFGATRRAMRQFVLLGPGDGLDREHAVHNITVFEEMGLRAASVTARASLQARGEIAEHPLVRVPGPIALVALGLCLVLGLGWSRHLARDAPAVLLLLGVVVLGAVANAGAIGFGGEVHPRYQARLAWLFPLAAVAALSAVLRKAPPA